MKPCHFLLLGLTGLASLSGRAQTGAAPRQLGTPPRVPPSPTPVRAPAPRQLGQVPAVPATAPTPTPPADSVRRAAGPVPTPPPAAGAGYGTSRVPGAEGTPSSPGRPAASRYQVGLKNGRVYGARDVTQKSPLFGDPFLLLDGQQRLELADVRFYEDETGHYVRATLAGTTRKTTLRRDQPGRLSLYSITSTQYIPGSPSRYGYGSLGGFGMPYGGYRTVKTEYFAKDNGPIQFLTPRNLALATADSPSAQTLLAGGRRYQTYATLGYVVGGGLLVAGAVQSLRPGGNRRFSPLMLVALPVLVVPLVLKGKQAQAQKLAIALYNRER